MKTDQELRQGFKIFVDNGNVINLIFLKQETKSDVVNRAAELVEEDVLKIVNDNPQIIYNGLIDISIFGNKISSVSQETRKTYAKAMSHKQLKNIAIVGLNNIFYKTVIALIAQAAGKQVKWFSDKEEAIKWLKEQK